MKLIIKYTNPIKDEEFVDLYNIDSSTDADEIVLNFERSKNFIVILGHVTLTEEQFQVVTKKNNSKHYFWNK